MYEYEGVRRVFYDFGEGEACFLPVCPQCGRFVKAARASFRVRAGTLATLDPEPNAMCSKCGSVTMPFEGFL